MIPVWKDVSRTADSKKRRSIRRLGSRPLRRFHFEDFLKKWVQSKRTRRFWFLLLLFTLISMTVCKHVLSHNNLSTRKQQSPSWNGFPLTRVSSHLSSNVHCVGTNFLDTAWQTTSCEFVNLCFRLETQTFVLLVDNHHTNNQSSQQQPPTFFSSTDPLQHSLSLGGAMAEEPRRNSKPWFPTIESYNASAVYYQLPDNLVWIPFYPRLANNAGHLLWDNWLAIYNLLRLFDLQHLDLLLTNLRRKGRCRAQDDWCRNHLQRFQNLLHHLQWTQPDTPTSTTIPNHAYICAPHGAAGVGLLTDHGMNRHGQDLEDYQRPHNVFRGPLLWDFRNHVLQNLGIHETHTLTDFQIVCSLHSSRNPIRDLDFQAQQRVLREASFSVQAHVLSEWTLLDQVTLATQTAVFLVAAGGGSFPATFLPRGASLLLYYDDTTLWNRTQPATDDAVLPPRLDWDLWNHMSHVRVHYLPISSMKDDLDKLVALIRAEQVAWSRRLFVEQ